MSNSKTPTVVEIKECDDGSGDVYFEVPPEMLKSLGWVEGDDVKFDIRKDGSIQIKKVKYETIELDFDDEELFKYMLLAHKKDMSFNAFIEDALKSIIKEKTNTGYPIGNDADFGKGME
jgi:hypothetical protein